MKNKKLVIIGLVAVIIIFSIKTFNDYREKSMEQLIRYSPSNFKSLVINFELQTDNEEHAKELTEFLSQYRVKKMRNREWEMDVSGMKGFHVSVIPENGKTQIASIYEDRLHYFQGHYYTVLNGPIDMEWVNNYIGELQGKQ